MRRLSRSVRVEKLKVRARILERGKKKVERRKMRAGIQRRIRELADRHERILVESADERHIYKFQPEINTDELDGLLSAFFCVHLW